MALQPGTRFGRYELVSRLGRGGMAETYRARLVGDAGVTKPVLIKKILPEYATDQSFTTMFISEARISATLSHGNIAQVFDFGRVDDEYFLAMEYVDGQPLHRIIKRALRTGSSSIPAPIAAFIGLELCRGLHYAHTRKDDGGKPLGIVHRDISPDNVLISYEGQVKIVDFGIAKARELRGFNTEPGVVKGKYLFFSPEQARGKEVDPRTDVWATGIVLYELVCGRLPVRGPQHEALPRLVKGDFPRPRELNPELSAELEDIIMQALAVDREQRTASCHEVGDALAGFLYSHEPRFSAMSLSYFVQELFREDLVSEGRQVQIPRSFQEQLARWRGEEVATQPVSSPMPARKGLSIGLGAGAVLMVAALLLLLFFAIGEPRPQPPEELSALKPLPQATRQAEPARKEDDASLRQAPQETRAAEPERSLGQPTPAPTPAPQPSPAPPAPRPPPVRTSASAAEEARIAAEDAGKKLRAGNHSGALTRALRCIELTPGNAQCHLVAGTAYARAASFEKAAQHYRKFLKLAPDHRMAPRIRRALDRYETNRTGL